MSMTTPLAVGLAVGQGTGPELADVFERVVHRLAQLYSVQITVHRSPRIYHSYFSLLAEGDVNCISRLTLEDAAHYEEFCRQEAAIGTSVIFRTAMNAQSLYLVRQHLHAIKIERLFTDRVSLLLIRDQAQGFYAGDNTHELAGDLVVRTCKFIKQLTARIVSFAIDQARQEWGHNAIDRVIMVYKFHLLDGLLTSWVQEWSTQYGLRIEIFQPDTANRNLINNGLEGHILMIGSNEWVDIMHVVLLDRFALGPQENRFTENVYLHPDLYGLAEYQTVHGSADDLAGKGLVNPIATMRAAAAIMERHASCDGAKLAMEQTLQLLYQQGIITPDQGGNHSTEAVVDTALDSLALEIRKSPVSIGLLQISRLLPTVTQFASMGKKTALLVIDFQNDFCTREGIGAEYRGDLTRMAVPIQNIPRVIDFARKCGIEVIFLQFLGDEKYQKPNWRDRDRVLHKRPKCCEGSWGAAFHGVSPSSARNEHVFTKYAHFDAFLCEGFENYLEEQRYEHLVLVGVYSDVCIDSTARTAFQKGYYLTVISDCTTSLHLKDKDILNFMSKVYGARILTHSEFLGANGLARPS